MYGSSSWGSYGSSSSLSSTLSSKPMDIAPRSTYTAASCAFPSWPRRSSLDSEDSSSSRPTAFLSDEDLMGDPFDDYSDAGSVTSASSSAEPSPPQHPTADEVFQMQRERAAMEYALVQQVAAEKERRRQAKKAQQAAAQQYHRRSSPKKSSHRSKLSNMTPIAE